MTASWPAQPSTPTWCIDPVVTETDLAGRLVHTRAKAGDRADDITFCFPSTQVALHDAPNLDRMRALRPDLAETELEALPTVRSGTIDQVTAKSVESGSWASTT